MGQRIPFRYVGHASRKQAVQKAVSKCASMQFGVTHLSWVDVIQQVSESSKSEENFGNDLQALVMEACPEYARNLTSWQHVTALCTRVDPQCFQDAERILGENGIPLAILPQKWYREVHLFAGVHFEAPRNTGPVAFGTSGCESQDADGGGGRLEESFWILDDEFAWAHDKGRGLEEIRNSREKVHPRHAGPREGNENQCARLHRGVRVG